MAGQTASDSAVVPPSSGISTAKVRSPSRAVADLLLNGWKTAESKSSRTSDAKSARQETITPMATSLRNTVALFVQREGLSITEVTGNFRLGRLILERGLFRQRRSFIAGIEKRPCARSGRACFISRPFLYYGVKNLYRFTARVKTGLLIVIHASQSRINWSITVDFSSQRDVVRLISTSRARRKLLTLS